MEIITGVERRRRWRREEKLRIVAEVEQPGASFAAVARRHELSRGLLWNWPVRLSGTVYCHKAGSAALAVLRHRWMVAGWTLKVRATSLMERPSSTKDKARVF